MTVPLARRNLFQNRTRLLVSVGGMALAALLILALDAVFAGASRDVSVFMDNVPFDLVVSQKGVRNLHMTTSFFPARRADEIERVAGVRSVDPILYTTAFLGKGTGIGQRRAVVYLIGYEPGRLGGPWEWQASRADPKAGGIVIDERIAADFGVRRGQSVTAAGREWRVDGLTKGTVSVVNSIAFVRYEDFEDAQGVRGVTSFALVRVAPGHSPQQVAQRIAGQVDDVTVQTREEFSTSERRIVGDMSIDIMRMMNAVAFLIGLSVVALSAYTTVLAKVPEYGIMKAMGAKDRRLLAVVVAQTAMSIALGLAVAMAAAWAMELAIELARLSVPFSVEVRSLVRVAVGATVVGLIASLLPVMIVSRLQPAEVFRR